MTAQQQSAAFFEYVDNNKYLSAHKGGYAERFGDVRPGSTALTSRSSGCFRELWQRQPPDIAGVSGYAQCGNLLNDSWGCYYYHALSSYDNVMPLRVVAGGTATAAPLSG